MSNWSRYNTLFHSERFGYFLYNAMSNSLFEFDEPHYRFLEKLETNPSHRSSEIEKEFLELLKEKHVLVGEGGDEKALVVKQYLRNCSCYGHRDLSISICPTLACNFGCSYCFEKSQHQSTVMSDKTVEKLVMFMKERAGSGKITLDWYGGEPTLVFDTIHAITRRVLAEGLNMGSVQLVTNGYLLDREKIHVLNDLKIDFLQITLDGPREVHDRRRYLQGGGPTFERIIANIDALMDSSFKGKCYIRVNLDKTNITTYVPFREELLERYRDKKVTVYATPVKGIALTALSSDEWVTFCIDLYRSHGIITNSMFYPHSNDTGSCVANFSNMFVIGPHGEIYICWEDVGDKATVVGNICNDPPITNQEILARYGVGTDQYADEECRKCSSLPICAEICPRKRFESRFVGVTETPDSCTHFKEHLVPCLEVFYDIYLTSEISRNLLAPAVAPRSRKGYRLIRTEQGNGTAAPQDICGNP